MNQQRTKSVRNNKFVHPGLIRLFPALVLLLLVLPAYAKYGGSGTLADPYKIATAEQLYDIGNHQEDWDHGKCFKLVADIDLSAYKNVPFTPIGPVYGPTGVYEDRWFNGVFDGDGHTISNFTYHSPNFNDVGLFGTIHGEVKNLGLVNVDVSRRENVGGLAGGMGGGYRFLVSNCYMTGRVSGQNEVGGLIKHVYGRIHNCYATTDVSGDTLIGGLVGRADENHRP